MSADDLLYSPIGSSSPADFLVRKNKAEAYDWKPLSSRAHAWCARWFPSSYDRAMESHNGWICRMSVYAGPCPSGDLAHTAAFNLELIGDNYVFEQIDE